MSNHNSGVAFQINTNFVTQCCNQCNILFAVPYNIHQEWVDKGTAHYCPNGHTQRYGPTTIANLKKQNALLKEQRNWAEKGKDAAIKREDKALHKLRAEKGAKTKLKKRIANGVCPCCNRTFVNLHRHMKGQHPEYTKSKPKKKK